jgi:hypothetical protein
VPARPEGSGRKESTVDALVSPDERSGPASLPRGIDFRLCHRVSNTSASEAIDNHSHEENNESAAGRSRSKRLN